MYEGTIAADSTAIHQIPVPPEFATGAYKQRLRIALAYDPPVRRSRRDYVAGEMVFDFVRNCPIEEVVAAYSAQPTAGEIAQDSTLFKRALPHGRFRPKLEPGTEGLGPSTLRCRTFAGSWNPDDDGYFAVVTHRARPWANSEERADQSYAIAVELSLSNQARIDLLARVRAQIRQRARVRVGQ